MSKNIIWTVEGSIKEGQKETLLSLMNEMVSEVQQEPGTITYEWTLGTDGDSLHVYERYQDVAATFAHLGTWGKFAERFMASVDITNFVVFSDLPPELKEAVSGLNPVYMSPIGGFAK
ncbi:MAG: antibiotic biosynthesis monooxygenase [Bacteroidota bacterium]